MWAVAQKNATAVEILLAAGADHSAKSGGAGLPRNYLAQRVNVRAVEEAQRRHQRAIAAGRTYEQQLEWEYENNVDLGGARMRSCPTRARRAVPSRPGRGGGCIPDSPAAAPQQHATSATPPSRHPLQDPPAAAEACGWRARGDTQRRGNNQAPDPDDNDTEVVVAGLVGSGGGGLTPLVFAAREGDLESARLLVKAGANINQQTEYGWTPLLTAVNNRNYRVAQFLIEQGANVNLANKGGWTPLYLAVDNRNIEGGDDRCEGRPWTPAAHRAVAAEGRRPEPQGQGQHAHGTIFTMQWFSRTAPRHFIRASQSSDTA